MAITFRHTINEPMTVSEGTLRTDDLINAFENVLRSVDCEWSENLPFDAETATDNEKDDYLACLFDVMDSICGEKVWFGSHEGDGACFGFWLVEDWTW